MYCITDQQVDYILNDIRRNGVEMEDLQLNLLDHVCCIIEQNLKEDDDFELFYQQTIAQFYKKELREIEEETINLLMFKNYYSMKKFMFFSGAFSAVAFIIGSLFKIMYWQGASFFLVLGFITIAFVFLPILFVLKTKETNATRDKLIMGVGTFVGMLYCLSMLFKVQHWPGGNIMWVMMLVLMFAVFIPAYFFTGIRKPETKVNTIISTVLLVAVLGIQFTLTNIRPNKADVAHTYLQNEQILTLMTHEGSYAVQNTNQSDAIITDINNMCISLKRIVLKKTIGQPALPADYTTITNFPEQTLGSGFMKGEAGYNMIMELRKSVQSYNGNAIIKVPVSYTILETDPNNIRSFTNLNLLNDLTQIQMFLAGNHNKMVAVK